MDRTFPTLRGETVIVTDADCPECKQAGNLTAGGATPKLRATESEPDRLFCIGLHGYVTV